MKVPIFLEADLSEEKLSKWEDPVAGSQSSVDAVFRCVHPASAVTSLVMLHCPAA